MKSDATHYSPATTQPIDRAAGILLHISSLPGPFGIGDLGSACDFLDGLASAHIGLWQVLPLSPTGYGDSPYQSLSAFAGNPLLVDLSELVSRGWLDAGDLGDAPSFPEGRVDFEGVAPWRMAKLRSAFSRFQADATAADRADLDAFCQGEQSWLDEFATFIALKTHFGQAEWTRWPERLVARDSAELEVLRGRLAGEIRFHAFVQWCFFRQWRQVKEHAARRGVRIVGDVPIFVAHDSADVWANQRLFQLDEQGLPRAVAGVPPDYFSASGQLWGNPLFDWRQMAAEGYAWWIARLSQALAQFDYVRLDHFRGFESYWEIPAGAQTAVEGHWAPGPGAALFSAATAALGPLPLIAEDLGVITPAVEALRDQFGYPGMRVLQFAFGDDPKSNDYLPHHYIPHCVAYTGTHDNDTTVGWFHSQAGEGTTRSAEQIGREREFTLRYLGTDGLEIHWDLIRLAMASVAHLAIFPMQDVLGLGSEARMNMPSTTEGNWRWRMASGQWTHQHQQRLCMLAETFGRELFTKEPQPLVAVLQSGT